MDDRDMADMDTPYMKYFYKDITGNRWMLELIDGCSIGCKYCNAYRAAIKLGYAKSWKDWLIPKYRKIDIHILEKELAFVLADKATITDFVFVCSTSDVFQNDETTKLNLDAIRFLNSKGIHCRVLTKSDIPKEYFALRPSMNSVGITICSLEHYYNQLARGAIEKLQLLSKHGFFTMLSMQPFSLATKKYELKIILEKMTFVDQIVFGPLDKQPERHFKEFLELSDTIALFCIDKKINFFNGTKRFNAIVKDKLKVKQPIVFRTIALEEDERWVR